MSKAVTELELDLLLYFHRGRTCISPQSLAARKARRVLTGTYPGSIFIFLTLHFTSQQQDSDTFHWLVAAAAGRVCSCSIL